MIVGYSDTIATNTNGQPYQHAVLWSGDTVHDLGTLGGDTSYAQAINDLGEVAGSSMIDNEQWHAFAWNAHSGIHDLGTLGGQWSTANSINNTGKIVGSATTADGAYHAFLWSEGVGLQDLNDRVQLPSGVRLVSANSINNQGWITGVDGQGHLFLLTPKVITGPIHQIP